MTHGAELDDPQAEAAIGWMVEMMSGEMSEKNYRTFETWLRADPSHERAWVRLQEGLMPCGVAARHGLDRDVLATRFLRKPQSRRSVLTGIAGLAGAGTIGLAVTDRFLPLSHVLADRFTLTAQQERVSLADGSELLLAPRSAVDLLYREGMRAVNVLDGKVMVRIAERAAPFQVGADGVDLEATSGTFVVEKQSDGLTLAGLAGHGRARLGTQGWHGLDRGDQLSFSAGAVSRQAIDIETAGAWVDGLLVAKDRTVASIVDGIRPYFPGIIRIDASASAIRATGVFSLKSPNDALDALASSLGLSIGRIARYWVSIGTR